FGEADILPLKKKGNSANALDYRPIALLNSAYKIFAQVISLRLQPLLVSTIGAQQQGFVPGRTLDDSIALFQRTLARQQRDPTLPLAASAAVICLDIKKAYDSMERAHLFCTMEAMGFPTAFVTLIERMHQDTSVQFVVNGIRSNRLPQTSGIRQGCPLAPSLFILGMEPLLATLHAGAREHGIMFQDGHASHPLICNAHVDDTAIYLQRLSSLPWILRHLQDYGDMSGLHIQLQKSFGICLNTFHTPKVVHGIPFVSGPDRRRYLGIQVGLGSLSDANWSLCYQSIEERLRLANIKPLHQPARAIILRAIVHPKIAFLATYLQPSDHWISRLEALIFRFWWRGSTVALPGKLPTYIAKSHLSKPTRQDGWGLPDVRRIAQQQALRRFVRLVHSPDGWAHAIALSGLQLPSGSPYILHPTARRTPLRPLEDSLLCGQVLASRALAQAWPRKRMARDSTMAFLQAARLAATFTWDKTGTCHCHMPMELKQSATSLQTALLSSTTSEWRRHLWHGQLHDNTWIRDHQDHALRRSHFDTFAAAFSETGPGDMWTFTPQHSPLPIHQAHLQYLYLLTLSMGLTRQPTMPPPLRRMWFPIAPAPVTLRRQPPVVKRISSAMHITLNPTPPSDTKYLRRQIRLCCAADLDHAPELWDRGWTDSQLPGALQWFMYRWHHQAFPFRTSPLPPMCPFCKAPDGPAHTFWLCPRAQTHWRQVLALWFGVTPDQHTSSYAASILQGEQLPPAPWLLASPNWTTHGIAQDRLGHQAWRLVRGLSLRQLWNDRCAALHANNDHISPPGTFPLLLQAHFAALTSYHTRRRHRLRAELYHALGSQCRLLNSPPIPPPRGQTPVRMDAVVFFDGAARLDPACGGSGALVMPREYPLLCDYDAHFIPTATTNNQAEYDGLLRSLQLAQSRGYTHLTVYGDSQLLMRQMQGIYRVSHPGLRAQYLQARRLVNHVANPEVSGTSKENPLRIGKRAEASFLRCSYVGAKDGSTATVSYQLQVLQGL
ncbi:hypothetical protein DYB26_011165, partial [Aphanomyces astaci]